MSEREPDAYLIERIKDALAADPRVGELHVEVAIVSGKVFLTGRVPTAERLDAAVEIVTGVVPELEVSSSLTVDTISGPPEVEKLS